MPTLTEHDIDVALNDAVQAVPELGSVTRLDDAGWLLELASGEELLAEWASDPPRLVLTASLGQPDAAHELLVYKTALAYNAHWQRNGSLRVARDPAAGDLSLLADLPASELQTTPLPTCLLRFEAARALWLLAVHHMEAMDASPPGALRSHAALV